MRQTIILARHGSHDEVGRILSGRSEIGLNDAGHAQAAAIARALAVVPLRSVHSSPRRRTRETAAPAARDHALGLIRADALDEIDFGRFTGQTFAALERDHDWHAWNARRDEARCPGGETQAEAVARATDYLCAIPAAAMPALCVTHCDIIRGLVAAIRGGGFDRLWEMPCDPGSLTELVVKGDELRLVSLNRRPG